MTFLQEATQRVSYIPRTVSLIRKAAGAWTLIWLGLLILQGVLPLITLYLTRTLVDRLAAAVGAGLTEEVIRLLLLPASGMAAVLLLIALLKSAMEWVRTAQSELVQDYVTGLVQSKAIALDFACYESSAHQDYLSRVQSGVGSQSLALVESLGTGLQNSITLLSLTAVLFTYSLWLPLGLLLATIPSLFILLKLNRQQHRWWQSSTFFRRWLDYYNLLLTTGAAAAEVRLYDLGEYCQERYQVLRQKLRRERLQLIKQQSLGKLGASGLTMSVAAVALAWMGRQLLLGLITLGDVALFYQAFSRAQSGISALMGSVSQVYRQGLFVNDLFEFLALPSRVVDGAESVSMPLALQRGLRFRQVTFAYPGSDRPVLKNFNLTIPAGKTVAVVGDNGAGKTTVMKLLCRLYDPDNGQIELDGIDLRHIAVRSLRQGISVVFQSPLQYWATPAENIGFGEVDQPMERSRIMAAARGAGVHERIWAMPKRYDTPLGKTFPKGIDLSGGEWQRLALARAFYRQAPLIVLDEPTSAMDPWSEADWLRRFRQLAAGRTAVVITHRFTLAMQADIIHVMRNGEIVESGSHGTLLARNGLYAQSWREQMQTPVKETPVLCDRLK